MKLRSQECVSVRRVHLGQQARGARCGPSSDLEGKDRKACLYRSVAMRARASGKMVSASIWSYKVSSRAKQQLGPDL